MKHVKMIGLSLVVGYALHLIAASGLGAPFLVVLAFVAGSLMEDVAKLTE